MQHVGHRKSDEIHQLSLVTDEEKLLCAKRELAMRERVYPVWVKNGKMKLDMAEYQIAVMKAIVADYEQKAITQAETKNWKDNRSIVCPTCGLRSYHPKDIEHKFCAKCGYHEPA